MARFELFVWDREEKKVPTQVLSATRKDLEITTAAPAWQTDWTTEYITESGFEIYALKTVFLCIEIPFSSPIGGQGGRGTAPNASAV